MDLDLNFINPFILASVEVLKVQAQLHVEGGKPFIKGKEKLPEIGIAGVIGVTSDQFRGAISILFEPKAYLKVISNMLGENITEMSPEIQDGAAELLNMIYGKAKTSLNTKGYALHQAIPTVIAGDNLTTHHQASGPALVVPLRTDGGFIFVEISVEAHTPPKA
jgi:chemotaxis protein CheX